MHRPTRFPPKAFILERSGVFLEAAAEEDSEEEASVAAEALRGVLEGGSVALLRRLQDETVVVHDCLGREGERRAVLAPFPSPPPFSPRMLIRVSVLLEAAA